MSCQPETPHFTQEHKEKLAELIYGYFVNDLKLSEEVASSIAVEFTYNPQPQPDANLAATLSSTDELVATLSETSFSVTVLRCIPGVGNGCWPGYRLG
jgi:hypothetical protein